MAAPTVSGPPAADRYLALDAYRGFMMIVLVSGGFGLSALRDHPALGRLAAQFDYGRWEGCTFWDLVQPAFLFILGAAMPFALARRTEAGATFRRNFAHVGLRAIKLLLFSQVLVSIAGANLSFQLINVLAQMAFTYFFCFLILQMRFRWQVVAAGAILAAHWALFVLFPDEEGAFVMVGNVGQVIDEALFGRTYPGQYVSINFISSTVTTLFGAWCGMLLHGDKPRAEKLKVLALAAVGCFLLGLPLSMVNPMIKRLWTASFTLFSAGWVILPLLAFVAMIEVWGWRRFAFPLAVVGMNSIAAYSIDLTLRSWLHRAVGVFTLRFEWLGTMGPVAHNCATMLAIWGLCYWLYRRRIFFKL